MENAGRSLQVTQVRGELGEKPKVGGIIRHPVWMKQ